MKAQIELIDRDGQPRLVQAVPAWPLSVGRGLDNDLVLSDPHVAVRHFSVEASDAGLELVVGDTDNGVQLGRRRLRRGERAVLDGHDAPVELAVGRTRLQLRLADQRLAPELPLAAATGLRPAVLGAAAALLAAALLFETWLVNDPTELPGALASLALSLAVGTFVWCGAWALLTKTFTRHARFGWHLTVVLFAMLGWRAADALPGLVGFAFSWPAVPDFAFVLTDAVGAAALYFHLLALEPRRVALMRGVAAVAWLTAVGLGLWFNQQREDRWGAELYLSHLYPPALRLAKPVTAEAFVDAMAPLQPLLDRKAKEPPRGQQGSDDAD